MAIPSKPLELTLDANSLTLDDLALFEPGNFSVSGFKAFMARVSNWSAAEVGALTIAELKSVMEQVGAKLRDAALPKATG